MPPARKRQQREEDSQDVEQAEVEQQNTSAAATTTTTDNEVLTQKCAEYVELNRQIREASNRVTLMRKTLKGLEKNLSTIMETINLEEIIVDGVKITRVKKLHVIDE